MAIPYRTTKFKSANILAIAILGSTAKFNSRQYSGYTVHVHVHVHVHVYVATIMLWRHGMRAWGINMMRVL